MIQLGICFGFAQQSYTLAHTLLGIYIINYVYIYTWIEKNSHNSEGTFIKCAYIVLQYYT